LKRACRVKVVGDAHQHPAGICFDKDASSMIQRELAGHGITFFTGRKAAR